MHRTATGTAVLTGAGSGIGRATALQLAERGGRVALAGRREAALEDTARLCRRAGGQAIAVATDVSDEQAVEALASCATETFGPIDVWVNNAAVIEFTPFGEEPMKEFRRVLEVNQLGYVHGARTVLPRFRDQGHGVLVNVGSVLSRVPAPYLTAYVMSKHAVRALSSCLRTELLDMPRVHVCTVMPGPVDTPLFDHAANRTGWGLDILRPVASPERVARVIVACADRPRREVLVGASQRLSAAAYTVAPSLVERVAGRMVHRSHFTHVPAERTEGNLFRPRHDVPPRTAGGWRAGASPAARRVAAAAALTAAALGGEEAVVTPVTARPAARERYDDVGGRPLFAREWRTDRECPRVVLVNGLVVSSAYFVPTAELLADRFHVLAPDLPGFGGSHHVDGPEPGVPDLAEALAGWIDAADAAPSALVANSFGCQIAVELAFRWPHLVTRLVLASPTVDPTARTVFGQLRRWRRETKTQSRALQRLLAHDYRRAGVRRALRTFRHALDDRIEDKLPYVEVPTLVVRGTNDPIVPGSWAGEVARLLPCGRLVVVPGAPHAMNFDAPELFVAAITDFLAEDGARSR